MSATASGSTATAQSTSMCSARASRCLDDLSEIEQREELAVLERLFTLRNKLVHPKPRQLAEIEQVGALRWRYDEYKPSKAAEFVTAVGEEAYLLSQLHDAVPTATTAYLVVLTKERILDYGRQTDTEPARGVAPSLTMEMLSEAFAERFGLQRDEPTGDVARG